MSIPPQEFPDDQPQETNNQEAGEGEQSPPRTHEPETAAEEVNESPPEETPFTLEQLPPEAQGEANGGPLGCCLGVMVGILLSLIVGVVSRFYPDFFIALFGNNLSIATRTIMAAALIAGAIIFGIVGWRVGKRFYREYEPSPRYLRKMEELEKRQRAQEQQRRRKARRSL